VYYNLDFQLSNLVGHYEGGNTCPTTVHVAINAFLQSVSFEDAIRNAVSVGGDSDTIASIAGSMAALFYRIPEDVALTALSYLDDFQIRMLNRFENQSIIF
jgi:ADP-ribosylglycohydrolase